MGAVDALDCGEGGGIAGLAGTTRIMTTMTRKRTSALSPTAAAAAATAIARCFTAGGVAMTTGGPGDDDGDVEANGCEGRTADDAFQDKNNLFRNPPEPGIRPESGEKDL